MRSFPKTVKSEKPAVRCLICRLGNRNDYDLTSWRYKHCYAKKTSRDYEKEKPSPFLKTLLHQSQTATTAPERKEPKSLNLWHERVKTALAEVLS